MQLFPFSVDLKFLFQTQTPQITEQLNRFVLPTGKSGNQAEPEQINLQFLE
jgi:hypothetical protein